MGTIKADTVTGLADPNKATIPNTITMGSTTATLNFGNTVIANASAGSSTITGEGGSTTTNLQQGLCKAWVFFDGDEGSLSGADSFNESSMTDHATGDYTFTITNAMANTNYSYSTSVLCEDNAPRGPKALGLRVDGRDNATTNTTTARRFECLTGARDGADGAAQDTQNGSIQYHGDLA